MSTTYKHGDRVPSDVLCNRLDELAHFVTKGPDVIRREFTMRVPAELDRDADLVMSQAARRIRQLEQALFGLKRGTDMGAICFCEMAIGHPSYNIHSKACMKAREVLGLTEARAVASVPQDVDLPTVTHKAVPVELLERIITSLARNNACETAIYEPLHDILYKA